MGSNLQHRNTLLSHRIRSMLAFSSFNRTPIDRTQSKFFCTRTNQKKTTTPTKTSAWLLVLHSIFYFIVACRSQFVYVDLLFSLLKLQILLHWFHFDNCNFAHKTTQRLCDAKWKANDSIYIRNIKWTDKRHQKNECVFIRGRCLSHRLDNIETLGVVLNGNVTFWQLTQWTTPYLLLCIRTLQFSSWFSCRIDSFSIQHNLVWILCHTHTHSLQNTNKTHSLLVCYFFYIVCLVYLFVLQFILSMLQSYYIPNENESKPLTYK